MRIIFSHIQNANDSLRSNRMRTFLTITGVAIGIASVITILALATGASRIISEQVDEVGGNIAVIRPGSNQINTSLAEMVNQNAHSRVGSSSLTTDDLEQISALPSVALAAPLMVEAATLHGDNSATGNLIGTTLDLLEMSDIELYSGEFTQTDQALVTIGTQLSINLFGTEESLGKLITVRGQTMRVGGILKRQPNTMTYNGVDFNNAALFTPEQLAGLGRAPQIQQINIQTNSSEELRVATSEINDLLLEQHQGEHDFNILAGEEIAAPTSQLFLTIASVIAAIAGISLFVGGIGIMNIMLVNVAERTREIGIRKALGASRSDIVWQFLIESIIMALVGGLAGGILGLASAFAISLFLTFDPVVTWHIAAVVIGLASAVGVLFGLYPALRAAHKDPIESLNQHN